MIKLKTTGVNSKRRFFYPFSMIFSGFEDSYKYLEIDSCRIFDRYRISNLIFNSNDSTTGFSLSIELPDCPAPVLLFEHSASASYCSTSHVDRAVNRQPDFRPETSVSRMFTIRKSFTTLILILLGF